MTATVTSRTYEKCDQGHTIYDGWCECRRTVPVGTDVYSLHAVRARNTRKLAGSRWAKQS